MGKTVDYYFTPASPYAYLGHDRFVALAARHGAAVDVCPVDIGKVFAVSGGVPLAQRPPQRLAYRLVELARWSRHLGIPINVPPKFGATPVALASRWILAAAEIGPRAALDFAGAVMRARWAEERDIADPATLAAIAAGLGLDAAALAARAETPEVATRFEATTERAIAAQVFGSPWYVYAGEPFWGQDRLDFLDRALAE
jgi:2-hydroxychromene-2-carboxylate isomerase